MNTLDHGAAFLNPNARGHTTIIPVQSWNDSLPFHRQLPHYAPSPLVNLPWAAQEAGVARVLLKNESSRLDLPAFKILGASWAIHLVLCERLSLDPRTTSTSELRAALKERAASVTLHTATDGNHGRAVARTAKLLDLRARIVVPRNVSPPSRALIASEGAEITGIDGDYDAAVRQACEAAASDGAHGVLVQDTSWTGYEDIPLKIVSGYATMFAELETQLADLSHPTGPDVIVLPVGVGSLAHSALLRYRSQDSDVLPAIATVEPVTAACLLTSLRKGEMTTIETGDTIMPGLCCGSVSPVAWPDLKGGVDAAVAVSDDAVRQAVKDLTERAGVDAGPCGAAALAALRAYCASSEARKQLRLCADAVVVLICTEGGEVYRESYKA